MLVFYIVHPVHTKHQATDALLRLKTTVTDQTPIEVKMPVLLITPSIHPGNGAVRVMYMQDYDALSDCEGIRIPSVHGIATATDTEYDKRLVTTPESTYKYAKD